MDSERKKALNAVLKRLNNPAVILDGALDCLLSNRPVLVPVGTSIADKVDLLFPLLEETRTMLILDGTAYCARICPIDGDLFFCELFSAGALVNMAEKTDVYGHIVPIFNALEHNTAKLWRTLFAMRDRIENGEDVSGFEVKFYDRISELSSVIKNVFEYSLMFTQCSPTIIDADTLTMGIVNKCNTLLAECGRCVQLVHDNEQLFIKADLRHTINALVNSLQNALLYSPRDCVPVLSLVRLTEEGKNFVYLQLVNDSALFVGDKEEGFDFGHQRPGFGIPIIRRFAEESGGSFKLDVSEKTVKLGIKLPEEVVEELRVEEGGYSFYDTGIPDIIDVKMREVVNIFT
ncbi:MAG: hypothetical protein NC299_06550 [Lachnospiraceae bacterium]|nr:hypothetical protein [Ruminococcus sp.]MCM1275014.1 hypothetical protein [Lachnospiraceae bacterium]